VIYFFITAISAKIIQITPHTASPPETIENPTLSLSSYGTVKSVPRIQVRNNAFEASSEYFSSVILSMKLDSSVVLKSVFLAIFHSSFFQNFMVIISYMSCFVNNKAAS